MNYSDHSNGSSSKMNWCPYHNWVFSCEDGACKKTTGVDSTKAFRAQSLLEESKDNSGPRRSRRERKAPVRYVDDKYAKLMFDDVELDKLDAVSDEDKPAVDSESEDDDYEQGSEEESDEDGSEADTEDDMDWQDEEHKSSNEATDVGTVGLDSSTAVKNGAVLTDSPTVVVPPSAKRLLAQQRQCIGMGGPVAKKSKVV